MDPLIPIILPRFKVSYKTTSQLEGPCFSPDSSLESCKECCQDAHCWIPGILGANRKHWNPARQSSHTEGFLLVVALEGLYYWSMSADQNKQRNGDIIAWAIRMLQFSSEMQQTWNIYWSRAQNSETGLKILIFGFKSPCKRRFLWVSSVDRALTSQRRPQ
jgi:hypothetical protein